MFEAIGPNQPMGLPLLPCGRPDRKHRQVKITKLTADLNVTCHINLP